MRGTRISSPSQTFLDLAGPLGLVDLVVLGDSLVRAGHVTPGRLTTAADAWRGHGAVLARRAARLVRVGVDSPMETRLRLLIVLAGLPEPVVNHTFAYEDGRWQMRWTTSGRFGCADRAATSGGAMSPVVGSPPPERSVGAFSPPVNGPARSTTGNVA